MSQTTTNGQKPTEQVSIAPLLKRLVTLPANSEDVGAREIALAFSRVFEDQLSGTQLSSLLTLLCSTGLDKHPDVIARCAASMRDAAAQVDEEKMRMVLNTRKRKRGQYRGGVCDIVGTGGDAHSTFNISTASSITVSPILAMAKHGNKASTSISGSADVLNALTPNSPNLEALTAEHLPDLYAQANFAFLYAPTFHPGMRHARTVRKELGLRTIFNLMGPLANPVEKLIEARIVGVAYQELGLIFARSLQFMGANKAMVVCGAEDMDEISCAGPTNCWWLKEVPNPKYSGGETKTDDEMTSDDEAEPQFLSKLETFQLTPGDFGFPLHPLSEVGGGRLPKENAAVLLSLLRNDLGPDHPIVHFVLINVAALLVVSGICESDTSEFGGEVVKERGPAGGRWKEGVRIGRWCLESGQALQQLEKFIELTNRLS